MGYRVWDAGFEHEVKSCGKRHAWCKECRPDIAERQRKKPAEVKEVLPCNNCGRCDVCLGLIAKDGFKICRTCKQELELSQFQRRADTGGYRNKCYSCRSGGKEKPSLRVKHKKVSGPFKLMCDSCDKTFWSSVTHTRWCDDCRVRVRSMQQQQRAKEVRTEALHAYSKTSTPSCECCGEHELMFLALDHVNGGGSKQRKETGGGGFWGWLRKNNYPPGFRILCHNCNFGRQLNRGHCPSHNQI